MTYFDFIDRPFIFGRMAGPPPDRKPVLNCYGEPLSNIEAEDEDLVEDYVDDYLT